MPLQYDGGQRYRQGNLVFDFSSFDTQGPRALADMALKARIIGALDLGFDRATTGTALGEQIAQLRGNGGERVIRIYSDVAEFSQGRQSAAVGPNGYASWVDSGGAGRENANVGLTSARTDLRIYVSPNASERNADGTSFYPLVINVVWHELLHLTSLQHHDLLNPNKDTPENTAWRDGIRAIAANLQGTAADPVAGPGGQRTTYNLKTPDQWSAAQEFTTFASDGTRTTFSVNDGGTLVGEDMWYAGGTRQQTIYDAGRADPWYSDTARYDVQGLLDVRIVVKDDGSRTQTDYDQANASATVAATTTAYDARGRVDWVETAYDPAAGGGRLVTDHDQSGGAIWSHTNTLWDARGLKDAETTFYRDGREARADWDLKGAQPWWSVETVFAPGGVADFQRFAWRDGGRTENDWDLPDTQPWWLSETVYAPGGVADFQRVTLDAGRGIVENDWDLLGQQPWWLSETVTAPNGHADFQRLTLDAGRGTIETDWDLLGQQPWWSLENAFAPGGAVDSQRFTWRDGSRTENDWDLLGQQPWWLSETVVAPNRAPRLPAPQPRRRRPDGDRLGPRQPAAVVEHGQRLRAGWAARLAAGRR